MSIFVEGFQGKRGDIFQEGCKFYIKSKLKSEMFNEIFNDKKKIKNNNIFSVIIKNLNWEF